MLAVGITGAEYSPTSIQTYATLSKVMQYAKRIAVKDMTAVNTVEGLIRLPKYLSNHDMDALKVCQLIWMSPSTEKHIALKQYLNSNMCYQQTIYSRP